MRSPLTRGTESLLFSNFMNEPVQRIQIFGERASGTNYLQQLLERNLPDLPVRFDFGWKHFLHAPGVETAVDCLFLVLYRNPFDWLLSLHRHPWHVAPELKQLSFSDFLRKEWRCVWNEDSKTPPTDPRYGTEMPFERDPVTHQPFANVLAMRTAKIRDWESLRVQTRHALYVRYEDLRADPGAAIARVAVAGGVATPAFFQPVTGYKGMAFAYRPRVERMDEADLDYIVAHLDPALEQSIGYDLAALARAHRAAS